MAKRLVISESAKVAALMERDKAVEFFFESGDFSVGDIYSTRVENIVPGIGAIFVNMGHGEKMGFLHASDIKGIGQIKDRVFPKQKLLVQVVKEPTGTKGPRVTTDITLIGRFFVLETANDGIVLSRKINDPDERARLKAISTLLKPPTFGLVVRTEAEGVGEKELEADFRELFLERWRYVIDQFESQRRSGLIIKDCKSMLYRVLRDVYHEGVDDIYVDTEDAEKDAKHYLKLWLPLRNKDKKDKDKAMTAESNAESNDETQVQKAQKEEIRTKVHIMPTKELLIEQGVLSELKRALSARVDLPSGGYLMMQATEAMTVVDVNSGRFTSSRNPKETVLLINTEAATEIARQIRLRNIGGVIVVDFIDMEDKSQRIRVLEHFEKQLEIDPVKPQIGRLSDLGLVEITRHRQERSLSETLGRTCDKCSGTGTIYPFFEKFLSSPTHTDAPVSFNINNGFDNRLERAVIENKIENKDAKDGTEVKSERDLENELLGFDLEKDRDRGYEDRDRQESRQDGNEITGQEDQSKGKLENRRRDNNNRRRGLNNNRRRDQRRPDNRQRDIDIRRDRNPDGWEKRQNFPLNRATNQTSNPTENTVQEEKLIEDNVNPTNFSSVRIEEDGNHIPKISEKIGNINTEEVLPGVYNL